jgi:hypothetical protein
MARASKEFPTSGPQLWFIRLFILPHTFAGVFLLGQTLLAFLWLVGGDDTIGRITRAWTEQHKGTCYYVAYQYDIGTVHSDQTSISESLYQQLPESIRHPQESSPEQEDSPTTLLRLRVFNFGNLKKVSSLPPYGRYPIVEFGQTFFVTAFWNGILSVFLYQAWVRPYRLRRASVMLKPSDRTTRQSV